MPDIQWKSFMYGVIAVYLFRFLMARLATQGTK